MRKKYPLILLAGILLFLLLCPAALAEEDTADQETAAADTVEEDTWEDRLLQMLAEHGANPETIGAGYYNFVTGEEHFFNPDGYRISGSMYKVPMNMLMLDWIAEGRLGEEETVYGRRYQDLLEGTVIHSNNDDAQTLWTWIGEHSPELPGTYYHRYRILIAPYMGEDPETVDAKFYENNFFTPRQMLTCMKQLYDGGLRYERLVKAMRKAEPDKYFSLKEKRFEIAHKYGWYVDNDILYMNDCALCYTDDPIAIVLFTSGTGQPYGVMADFCALMCDYTQEQVSLRLERERLKQEEEETEELSEMEGPRETELLQTIPTQTMSPGAKERIETELSSRHSGILPLIVLAVSAVLLIATVALLAHQKRAQGLRFRFGLLALLFASAAVALSILAGEEDLTLIRNIGENPQETVIRFFDCLISRDYESANACLLPGSDLGLSVPPEGESRTAFLQALENSWDYRLFGECVSEGSRAWQQLQLSTLNFHLMEEDLQSQMRQELAELARTYPKEELYDQNGDWRQEAAAEAWEMALLSLTEHAQDYRTTVGIQLELQLTGDGWRIVPDRSLLNALSGQPS